MIRIAPTVQCFEPDASSAFQRDANFFFLAKRNLFIVGFFFSSARQTDQYNLKDCYLLARPFVGIYSNCCFKTRISLGKSVLDEVRLIQAIMTTRRDK